MTVRREQQFVYVLTDGLSIKVGRSSDVHKRVKAIQCGCPRRIVPVCAFGPIDRRDAAAFEREMHREMRRFRQQGEWFACALDAALAAAFLRAPWFCGVLGRQYLVFCNDHSEAVWAAAERENACRDKNHPKRDEKLNEVRQLLSCFTEHEVMQCIKQIPLPQISTGQHIAAR